jgi:hypothetical protein
MKEREFHRGQLERFDKVSEEALEEEQKSRGLGDTIARLTKITKIDKLVRVMSDAAGTDCGCKGRQEKLNEIFPYKK